MAKDIYSEALQPYADLGYNIDYKSGVASPAPDVSQTAFNRARGMRDNAAVFTWDNMDSWVDTQLNQYNSYLSAFNKAHEEWYNSDAERLARARGIGQNPFYLSSLGGSSGETHMPTMSNNGHNGSGGDSILGLVDSSLSSAYQLASLVAGVRKQSTESDFEEQKTIGQMLENEENARYLGLTRNGEGLSDIQEDFSTLLDSETFEDFSHNLDEIKTLDVARVTAEKSHPKAIFGKGKYAKIFENAYQNSSLTDKSLWRYNKEMENRLLSGNADLKISERQLKDALTVMTGVKYRILQFDEKQQEEFFNEVWPIKKEMEKAKGQWNVPTILEKGVKEMQGKWYGDIGTALLYGLFILSQQNASLSFSHRF